MDIAFAGLQLGVLRPAPAELMNLGMSRAKRPAVRYPYCCPTTYAARKITDLCLNPTFALNIMRRNARRFLRHIVFVACERVAYKSLLPVVHLRLHLFRAVATFSQQVSSAQISRLRWLPYSAIVLHGQRNARYYFTRFMMAGWLPKLRNHPRRCQTDNTSKSANIFSHRRRKSAGSKTWQAINARRRRLPRQSTIALALAP